MPERPLAPGYRGTREIECGCGGAVPLEGAGRLDDARRRRLLRVEDRRRQGRDIDGGIVERGKDGAEVGGRDERQVALQVHDDVVHAGWVERGERGVDAVGAGRQRRVRQHRDAARVPHGIGDLWLGAGDRDRPDPGLQRHASTTWTTIGRPARQASGLPGSRVLAMRAGITTMGFTGAGSPRKGSSRAGLMRQEGSHKLAAP